MPSEEEQRRTLYGGRLTADRPPLVFPSGFGPLHQLCLHYYSNLVADLLPSENEEVYPLYSIKDWNDIPNVHWIDVFCLKNKDVKGNKIYYTTAAVVIETLQS